MKVCPYRELFQCCKFPHKNTLSLRITPHDAQLQTDMLCAEQGCRLKFFQGWLVILTVFSICLNTFIRKVINIYVYIYIYLNIYIYNIYIYIFICKNTCKNTYTQVICNTKYIYIFICKNTCKNTYTQVICNTKFVI